MRIFILALLLMSNALVSAQTAQENVKVEFKNYYELVTEMKIEESMDYVIEDFFEIFPRASFIKVFESLFNNPEFEFEFEAKDISELSKVIKQKDAYYVVFTNNGAMKMKINPEDENETEEEKELRNSFTEIAFVAKYGAENVSFNEETGFFTIYPRTRVCAKSFNGKTDWKFLNIEEDQMEILKKIIPKKVIKAA